MKLINVLFFQGGTPRLAGTGWARSSLSVLLELVFLGMNKVFMSCIH